jgi:hypothetical protein
MLLAGAMTCGATDSFGHVRVLREIGRLRLMAGGTNFVRLLRGGREEERRGCDCGADWSAKGRSGPRGA